MLKQLKGKSAFSDPHITTSGHSCRGKHKSAQMKNAASPSRSLETCTASSTSQVQGRSNRCKKKEKDAAHLMSDHTQGPQSHPHAEVWMLETKWKSDFVLNLLIFIFTTQNSLEPNFQLTSNFLSCFHSSVSSCCSSQIKRQHPLQLWTLYCSTYTCEPPGAPPCRLRGKHQVVKNEENTRN